MPPHLFTSSSTQGPVSLFFFNTWHITVKLGNTAAANLATHVRHGNSIEYIIVFLLLDHHIIAL